jgi:four helix bundle protein
MSGKILSYQDLKVWQEGRKLAGLIYQNLRNLPDYEKYGIGDQMRRAAVSVPSNIAEGFGRSSAKEKNQFYYIAKGSLAELETQLYIASDVGYINKEKFDELMCQSGLTQKLLQGLIKANKERL